MALSQEATRALQEIKELHADLKAKGITGVIVYFEKHLWNQVQDELGFCHDGDYTYDGMTALYVKNGNSTFKGWTIGVCK